MRALVILTACLISSLSLAGKYQVAIKGMTCQMCAAGITKELKATKKIQNVSVDVTGGSATFESIEKAELTDKEINDAIHAAGYEATKINRT